MAANHRDTLELTSAEFIFLLNSQLSSPAPIFGPEFIGDESLNNLTFFPDPTTLKDLQGWLVYCILFIA